MGNGGVLTFSNEIRSDLMAWGSTSYSQYEDLSLPGKGDYYNIYNRKVNSLTYDEGLYRFTHDSSHEEYSTEIRKQYFTSKDGDVEKIMYEDTPIEPETRNRWRNKYGNYVKYVSDTIGHEVPLVKFFTDIMSNVSIKYALKDHAVGVVFPDVDSVISGNLITTNPNTLGFANGKDTDMGQYSNKMYAYLLRNAATFNTERGRNGEKDIMSNDRQMSYSYITPSLYKQYGNNEYTYRVLRDLLRIDETTGRITEDLGADVKIMQYAEMDALKDYNYKIYLSDAFKNQVKYAFSGQTVTRHLYAPSGATVESSNRTSSKFEYFNIVKTASGNTITESTDFDGIEALNKNGGNYTTVKINGQGSTVKYNLPKTYFEYSEGDNPSTTPGNLTISDNDWSVYNGTINGTNHLLAKTNQMFAEHKINTMIGRFHDNDTDNYVIDTAIDDKYGHSHGRNLLKKNHQTPSSINGYEDPYCRVWTYHNQYSRYSNAMRPFYKDGNLLKLQDIQSYNHIYRADMLKSGGKSNMHGNTYLARNSVLDNDTNLVRITPQRGDKFDFNDSYGGNIRRYMFSLENLAWKDVKKGWGLQGKAPNLSPEQTGPNGGRIMWFPPYDISFQENVNVDWQPSSFIGRGEKVYTYSNTDRTGTLSFTLLIDHPALLNSVNKQNSTYSDDDILRFFAGCDMIEPDGKDKNGEGENGEGGVTQGNPEGDSIVFYVFFPNNYSGNGIATNAKYTGQNTDPDWFNYIMFGTSAYINKTCVEASIGYEVSPIGITHQNSIGNASYYINSSQMLYADPSKSGKWNKYDYSAGLLASVKNREYKRFYYRVDFDLRQPTLMFEKNVNTNKAQGEKLQQYAENYSDTYSKQLNINLNSVTGEEFNLTDATCTFGEFMCALADNGHYFGLQETSSWSNGDVKNFMLNQLKFVDEGLTAESEGRIDQLKSILRVKESIKRVDVIGCATSQDAKNSGSLADRRANTVKNLIHGYIGDGCKYVVKKEVDDSTKGTNDHHYVNRDVCKKTRRAKVILWLNDSYSNTLEGGESVNQTPQLEAVSGMTAEGAKAVLVFLENACKDDNLTKSNLKSEEVEKFKPYITSDVLKNRTLSCFVELLTESETGKYDDDAMLRLSGDHIKQFLQNNKYVPPYNAPGLTDEKFGDIYRYAYMISNNVGCAHHIYMALQKIYGDKFKDSFDDLMKQGMTKAMLEWYTNNKQDISGTTESGQEWEMFFDKTKFLEDKSLEAYIDENKDKIKTYVEGRANGTLRNTAESEKLKDIIQIVKTNTNIKSECRDIIINLLADSMVKEATVELLSPTQARQEKTKDFTLCVVNMANAYGDVIALISQHSRDYFEGLTIYETHGISKYLLNDYMYFMTKVLSLFWESEITGTDPQKNVNELKELFPGCAMKYYYEKYAKSKTTTKKKTTTVVEGSKNKKKGKDGKFYLSTDTKYNKAFDTKEEAQAEADKLNNTNNSKEDNANFTSENLTAVKRMVILDAIAQYIYKYKDTLKGSKSGFSATIVKELDNAVKIALDENKVKIEDAVKSFNEAKKKEEEAEVKRQEEANKAALASNKEALRQRCIDVLQYNFTDTSITVDDKYLLINTYLAKDDKLGQMTRDYLVSGTYAERSSITATVESKTTSNTDSDGNTQTRTSTSVTATGNNGNDVRTKNKKKKKEEEKKGKGQSVAKQQDEKPKSSVSEDVYYISYNTTTGPWRVLQRGGYLNFPVGYINEPSASIITVKKDGIIPGQYKLVFPPWEASYKYGKIYKNYVLRKEFIVSTNNGEFFTIKNVFKQNPTIHDILKTHFKVFYIRMELQKK